MDSARWQRIQELFHAAADLPEAGRESYLKSQCGNDHQLRAEVQALLTEDLQSACLLDHNVGQIAQEILGQGNAPPFVSLKFGPHRILEVLGEGGMGVVYLAEREDLGTRVAIKVLRDAWLSPARRDRFLNERRMLAQLNHPSIARLYDADTLDDGTPWFVMEYVEGLTLTEYCRERGCSVRERLELLRAVGEAVQYAHQNAVIHRDLKPSNILVRTDGTVRLLDFGIAKQLESLDVPAERTMTGLRLMTPAYASPEQIRGERVGIQTDVYSLGVILYELLAGRPPYELSNCTPGEAERTLLNDEPRKPSVLAVQGAERGASDASVPTASRSAWADLDVLCLTAMHKDLQRRYKSAEALIRDIDHYLKAEPLEARPDTVGYRLGKFASRNRNALAAVALIFVLVVGLVVFFMVRLTKARDSALEETARTNRIQSFMLTLFQGGDAAAGPAENLHVATLLDRGVQEARSLDADPALQAELYETLGGIYEKLGKFDQAQSLLRSALNERKSLYGPDHAEVAKSLTALALLRADQAKFAEAERLAREGLAMSERHLPPDHPAVAKAIFALGMVLEDRGAYTQAIPLFERAVKIQSASASATRDLAASLSELANSEFYLGEYDASEALNQRVLAMHRQLYGDRHPLVADTLINLGAIEFQRGDFAEDERYSRAALSIVRSWYGAKHPETADTMTIVAQSLTAQRRYGEAEAMLRQSLAILERAYGPVHPRVAYALNGLGNVAVHQGNLTAAEAYFKRELAIDRAVYNDSQPVISVTQSNLAGVYVKRKEYARAEHLFREALARDTRTLPAGHENVAIARIRLGNVLRGERKYAEAATASRAGYEVLVKQASPSLTWLQIARQDLVADYDALKQPEQAAAFRARLVGSKNTGAPVVPAGLK
jgi:eukaryotic-like serine/threonine-protein kinase